MNSLLGLAVALAYAHCFFCRVIFAISPNYKAVDRPDGLCVSLVSPYNSYDCQEFVVETDDQFLLGVQRISRPAYGVPKKGPILLLHGILVGGDVWVLNPPNEGFAFILADRGYDVYIGNTRTTRFSYGHAFYKRSDKGYWEWSVDELADLDLPAMLGFAQAQANQKVHYIGFSQGSQQAFAAFSQGRLLDVVNKVVMLAPIAYLNHIAAPVSLAAATFYIDKLYQVLHIYEFSTQTRAGREYVDLICKADGKRCFKGWISLFTGPNCCINYTRRPIIDEYETQPTSTKNLAHLAQQYRTKSFRKYDYGFWGNLKRYHWPYPPAYDISKVPTKNLYLINGGKDTLSDPTDVKSLVTELQGQFPKKFIPQYAHIDFILGTNANQLVYVEVMKFLDS